jgi:demethylmenaquinone methyltransferase/2-methoxy-6-polyprenyl-1,4-benzoquinol methylase
MMIGLPRWEVAMPNDVDSISRVTRTTEEAKATYDKISRWYDVWAGSSEKKYLDLALHGLRAKEAETFLEIGFGTGHGIVALAQAVGKTGKVYGIDLSEGMLNITHARIEKAGLTERVELRCGDAMKLPLESDFFDAVLMSFTLELFDTPQIPVVLAECRRVLRKGGRIAVVSMSKGPDNLAMRLYEWAHRAFPKYVDCRPIFVREALEEAGFQLLEVEEFSMFGLSGESVLAKKPQTTPSTPGG